MMMMTRIRRCPFATYLQFLSDYNCIGHFVSRSSEKCKRRQRETLLNKMIRGKQLVNKMIRGEQLVNKMLRGGMVSTLLRLLRNWFHYTWNEINATRSLIYF